MKDKKPQIKNMPILNMLEDYKSSDAVRFHMPGHKGKGFNAFKQISKLDITELSFSDNLLQASSIIHSAEMMYAKAYSCEAVKLCTCGSTVSILSLIHSLKAIGKSIIIARNSHKSIFSALKLSGIEPVIIDNEYDCEVKLYKNIQLSQIESALKQNPDVIGAFLTCPDYFGFTVDIKSIASLLKNQNKLLILDAAHGSHLPFFNKGFYQYADAFVCSAHKTLYAFTQAAFVCFNNFRLYRQFLISFNLFHTTSPSYLILASLDYAREYMVLNGKDKLDQLKKITLKYSDILVKIGYTVVQNNDFTKLIIDVSDKPFSGFELSCFLESKGVFIEFANKSHLLLMLSIADCKKSFKRLIKALKSFSLRITLKDTLITSAQDISFKYNNNDAENNPLYSAKKSTMPYLKAYNSPAEYISLKQAVGRISANEVGFYPPSTPILCCGDIITQTICDLLLENILHTFGLDNGSILVVK